MIKNRIIGSGIEKLDQILFNPRNWRIHPLNQQNALKEVLDEVGWVQEVIINKRTGHLVDGHLRCQLAARNNETEIPVKYIDVSEDEEKIILATLDPLSAMSAPDKEKLEAILADLEQYNNLDDVIKSIANQNEIYTMTAPETISFDDFSQPENKEFLYKVIISAIPTKEQAQQIADAYPNAKVEQYRSGVK